MDEGALAAFGLKPEDFDHETVDIWPENYDSFLVFTNMQTQWRIGMSGATGLDYNVIGELWRRLKIPAIKRDGIFQDIRIMEAEALKIMRKNSK